MRLRLIVATVLAVPVVEIAVLIAVGQLIGIGWALLLTVATSLVGTLVIRREGRRSLQRLREAMDTGQLPPDASGGALRMAGGIGLLVPGFVTDLVGLLLLVPPTRALLRRWLLRRFTARLSPETANQMFGPRRVRARRGTGGGTATDTDLIQGEVLEGEILDAESGEPVRPAGERTPE